MGPRIVFRLRDDEVKAYPALEASMSDVVIGDAGDRDNPTGESS